MIQVTFTTECIQFMRDLGIPHERAKVTINDRHRGLISDGLDRVIAIHWFGDDDIVLVDSLVKNKEVDRERSRTRIVEVQAQLVLVLQSTVPAGTLSRDMNMEQLFALVAESFGQPVVCFPDSAPSKLYSGPWNGQEIEIRRDNDQGSVYVAGSFYPNQNRCELIWAFNVERYRRWLADSALAGLVRWTPIPSRLALEPILTMAKAYVKHFPQLYPNVPLTSEAIQFGLALNVLRPALGDEWCRRNFLDPDSAHPLRVIGVSGMAAKKVQAQLVELGEMLFNLQAVPGFHARLEALKTKDLTSAVGELDAAKLLACSEIPFSFVEPSGQRGLDYEARVHLPSGRIGSCEVKTKSEETCMTDRTILNSLKDAGKQVPKDAPLIVFLKIPNHWLTDPGLKGATDTATTKFFRDYGRAIAVVFFWEEWLELETGTVAHLWKYKEIINQKSRLYDESDAHLIRSMVTRLKQSSWVRFPDLAAGVE